MHGPDVGSWPPSSKDPRASLGTQCCVTFRNHFDEALLLPGKARATGNCLNHGNYSDLKGGVLRLGPLLNMVGKKLCARICACVFLVLMYMLGAAHFPQTGDIYLSATPMEWKTF